MMDVKVSKHKNTLANGLIERTSSMLDKKESKTVHNDEGDLRGKRSKTLSEVKLVGNICKNLQSFLEIVLCKRKSFIHVNCKTMHMSKRIFLD